MEILRLGKNRLDELLEKVKSGSVLYLCADSGLLRQVPQITGVNIAYREEVGREKLLRIGNTVLPIKTQYFYKPVLFVFLPTRLEEAMGGPEAQKKAFDACREYARKEGFDGMTFATCNYDTSETGMKADYDGGYDFRFCYDYKLDPENFRIILRKMKQMTDSLPEGAWGKKIFMIDNWNEWNEGHYASPSHEFGFKYLQVIREELTFRDNLPDYRMPQDIGLSNFNKSWDTPDLSSVCRKKFGVEYD